MNVKNRRMYDCYAAYSGQSNASVQELGTSYSICCIRNSETVTIRICYYVTNTRLPRRWHSIIKPDLRINNDASASTGRQINSAPYCKLQRQQNSITKNNHDRFCSIVLFLVFRCRGLLHISRLQGLIIAFILPL